MGFEVKTKAKHCLPHGYKVPVDQERLEKLDQQVESLLRHSKSACALYGNQQHLLEAMMVEGIDGNKCIDVVDAVFARVIMETIAQGQAQARAQFDVEGIVRTGGCALNTELFTACSQCMQQSSCTSLSTNYRRHCLCRLPTCSASPYGRRMSSPHAARSSRSPTTPARASSSLVEVIIPFDTSGILVPFVGMWTTTILMPRNRYFFWNLQQSCLRG